jgi:predicted RNA methylase
MKLDEEVLTVFDGLAVNGCEVRITEQLERSLYLSVNKALEALGGKWNRKAKAHLFPTDAAKLIEGAQLTGQVTVAKDEYDFFETPPDVVKMLIELACIDSSKLAILEPSAGRGAIANAIRVNHPKAVEVCELMPENRTYLIKQGYEVLADDFLKLQGVEFDRIVMNPPFSKQQDVDHVLHAYGLLTNGGILVAVMSNGVTFRTNAKTKLFRDLVDAVRGEIVPLPEGSFKSSGTGVNTVIVKLRR